MTLPSRCSQSDLLNRSVELAAQGLCSVLVTIHHDSTVLPQSLEACMHDQCIIDHCGVPFRLTPAVRFTLLGNQLRQQYSVLLVNPTPHLKSRSLPYWHNGINVVEMLNIRSSCIKAWMQTLINELLCLWLNCMD